AVVGITSATTIDVSNVSNTSCDLDLTGVSATITVDPLPNAVTVSATATHSYPRNTRKLFTSCNSGGPAAYHTDGGPSVTGVITEGGTFEIAVVGTNAEKTIDVSNVSNMSCDLDLTGVSATITVDPLPNAVTVSATAPSVCSGDDGEFVVSGDAG
ncbi:hypothetical protein AB9K26_00145, partial [Psychroserpens sp. XS_ASV72]|uniref:hypothetical protein n=1 Tax=Psychroserpens sp. XS_ASV72 TaxID=3241293 RepID=UPI00351498EC